MPALSRVGDQVRRSGSRGEDGVVADDIAAGPVDRDAAAFDVQAEWDQRYSETERLWSGQPNGALVTEVAGLAPGRVLDVGCGEGADAIWLAANGWAVTALEVSGVALERATRHAQESGADIRWVHAGLTDSGLQ